jgi:hypothetical protein
LDTGRGVLKVIETANPAHYVLQRLRYPRIDRVGHVDLAIHEITMHLRAEGALNLLGRPAEGNPIPGTRHLLYVESMRGEPGRDHVAIAGVEPEAIAKLLGREPPMIIGRRAVLLFVEQSLERCLLFSRWLQHERYVVHPHRRLDWPLIRLRLRLAMDAARQSYLARVIDLGGYADRLTEHGRRAKYESAKAEIDSIAFRFWRTVPQTVQHRLTERAPDTSSILVCFKADGIRLR